MRFWGFLFSLFVLAGSVFGSEVLNPPNGNYIIVNDHIVNFVYQSGGADFAFGLGLSVPSFEEAQRVDEYIRNHVSAQNLSFNGYLGPFVLRRGGFEIVGGFVVLQTQEYSGEDYDDILNAVRACGYTINDEPLSYYDQGVAQISEDEPVSNDEPPTISEGCLTLYQGEWVYTDDMVVPANSEQIFVGPSLFAGSEAAARTCAANFARFLENYSWPWYGEPAILPFSEPVIYKCYRFFNGELLGVHYRIFFQDYITNPGARQFEMAYAQCLDDYSQGAGGTGGFNAISFYTCNPSKPYSDSLNARSTLAGSQLAADSDLAEGVSFELPQGIVFSQSTTAGVDAAQGDFVGESTVRSTANASTSGTTVNITNNTEVNTNLELGETPDDEVYEAEEAEEKEVADSDELLTEQEPEYTYIDSSSSEYKIDYEKLFEDCKEKIDEIFGTDELTTFLSSVPSGGNIQPWVVQWVDPWVHYNWGFTVDIGYVANLQIVQIIRMICNFGLYLGTLFMSIRLFA